MRACRSAVNTSNDEALCWLCRTSERITASTFFTRWFSSATRSSWLSCAILRSRSIRSARRRITSSSEMRSDSAMSSSAGRQASERWRTVSCQAAKLARGDSRPESSRRSTALSGLPPQFTVCTISRRNSST